MITNTIQLNSNGKSLENVDYRIRLNKTRCTNGVWRRRCWTSNSCGRTTSPTSRASTPWSPRRCSRSAAATTWTRGASPKSWRRRRAASTRPCPRRRPPTTRSRWNALPSSRDWSRLLTESTPNRSNKWSCGRSTYRGRRVTRCAPRTRVCWPSGSSSLTSSACCVWDTTRTSGTRRPSFCRTAPRLSPTKGSVEYLILF